MLAPMRSPHQRRARPPWTSTLGPKPSSDVCGLVVVLVLRVQPRLKKKQSCAGECADCSTRGGVTDLAAAGFVVFADAAAMAIAAAADLAIGRDCRTMMCSSSLSRPPARAPHVRSIATDRRLMASAPNSWKDATATTIPAACAQPRREGVAACASNGWRWFAWRVFRFSGVVVGVESTVPYGHASRGAASVPWAPRRCRVRSVTKRCVCANATRTTHNIAIQRDQVAAVFARSARRACRRSCRDARASAGPLPSARPEPSPRGSARYSGRGAVM
jgi:hypothetical protein